MDTLPLDCTVSRNMANKAGKTLCSTWRKAPPDSTWRKAPPAEFQYAINVAQSWRAQHAEATQRCFLTMLNCSEQFSESVCTYRLKRISSIVNKLQRPRTHLKLGELDDIGGCRLILRTNAQVDQAANLLKSKISLKQSGTNGGEKDYIISPPESGYRSRHLLSKVKTGTMSYQVEIQIRTQLQHYWATAVEEAGEIYDIEYKSPEVRRMSTGEDEERIRFFQIVSSLFATEEHSPQIPGFERPRDELIEELQTLKCSSRLLDDLITSTDSVLPPILPQNDDTNLFLLKLSREDQYLDIEAFRRDQLSEALRRYGDLEDRIEANIASGIGTGDGYDNVVLVYAEDSRQLGIAYPNYSTNIRHFVDKVKGYLQK